MLPLCRAKSQLLLTIVFCLFARFLLGVEAKHFGALFQNLEEGRGKVPAQKVPIWAPVSLNTTTLPVNCVQKGKCGKSKVFTHRDTQKGAVLKNLRQTWALETL